MQLKTITLLAASLAMASAGGWGDENSISQPVDGGDKPTPTPPTGGPKPPAGGPSTPVQGGTGPTPPSKPDGPKGPDGGAQQPPKDGPTPPSGGDKPTPPSGGDKPPTGTPQGPPKGPDGPKGPHGGSSTPVADETATPSTTWGDLTSVLESTTATPTSTDPAYWGDETSVADETTTSSTTSIYVWSDVSSVASETTTSSADPHTWSDYVEPPKPTPSLPVSGGDGNHGPPPKPDLPVSGGHGDNGAPPKPDLPVSGGNGKPPGGAPGVPADSCKVVTETKVNYVTVTVQPGKPTPPAPAPPVDTVTEAHTWADVAVPTASSAPKAPVSGGYYGVIQEWRAQLGLPDLELDSKLQGNALKCADESGGQLKHQLNPGSMAQVLAPGGPGDFEKCFVGGWLCEIPSLPGLGAQTCNEWSKGWNYAGQDGHAKILTDPKYTKIGCGNGAGIWACDLS